MNRELKILFHFEAREEWIEAGSLKLIQASET